MEQVKCYSRRAATWTGLSTCPQPQTSGSRHWRPTWKLARSTWWTQQRDGGQTADAQEHDDGHGQAREWQRLHSRACTWAYNSLSHQCGHCYSSDYTYLILFHLAIWRSRLATPWGVSLHKHIESKLKSSSQYLRIINSKRTKFIRQAILPQLLWLFLEVAPMSRFEN